MTHGPEHHIEHAEHATHAASDPFDRRVTISIAIVAAVLAGITMLGHKAHNETLRLQTESGIQYGKAANKWAQFQAQRIRSHVNSQILVLTDSLAVKEGTEKEREAARAAWKAKVAEYDVEIPKIKKEAEDFTDSAREEQKKSHDAHARAERFDLGELGLQLGVVLCSLSILTKGRGFWYSGLACSTLGLLVALSGFFGLFMEHH